ncbi:MAG: hypothetical protein WC455_26870 [Dehalococcoidia bacterium]|jgi:hypothetical protein
MSAQSEKHLEDYIWNHPESLGMVDAYPEYGEKPMYQMSFRQFQFPSGRVDLIGFDWRMCIFELKKGQLKAQALTQLMRYMCDAKLFLSDLMFKLTESEICHPWLDRHFAHGDFISPELLRGVLVGESIEDDNFLTACAACGVDVFLYQYNGNAYTFEQQDIPEYHLFGNQQLEITRLVNGKLGKAFIDQYREEILAFHQAAVQKHNKTFSATRTAEDYLLAFDSNGGES